MKKVLFRTFLLIILIAALLASAWCIWYIYQYYSGRGFKDDLREIGMPDAVTIDPEQETIEIPVDFDTLQQTNPDIYGWIEIPDSGISYAMLRREGDNNYYMNHAENGSYYSGGCVFSDDFMRSSPPRRTPTSRSSRTVILTTGTPTKTSSRMSRRPRPLHSAGRTASRPLEIA